MNTIANTLNGEKIRTSFDKVKIICMPQKNGSGKKVNFYFLRLQQNNWRHKNKRTNLEILRKTIKRGVMENYGRGLS